MERGTIKDFLCANGVDMTVNGKCSCCGGCCGRFLPLKNGEKQQIKNYVKKHHITECKVVGNGTIDFNCPFLDLSQPVKKCKIYEVRPEICRDFLCSDCSKKECTFPAKEIRTVDMRAEFFGDKNLLGDVLKEIWRGVEK